MTRILVVQLDESDPPGPLADWLISAGADLVLLHARREPVPATPEGYQAVVVLGGPMGANDVIEHPWLVDVRRLLGACVSARVPLLAICLGAQLLAVAAGGRVEVGDEGPEVGPVLVAKRDLGWKDPLFADLPLMPDVLHFHRDVVTRLPVTAALLAAGTRYQNQAFRIGTCAYAIQFHIETTVELVQEWAKADPELAAHAKPGDLDEARLVELHADIAEVWAPFAERFVRLAGDDLTLTPATLPELPLV